ncbi:DDE-type integrase/transposase/recombinase [Pseudomonas marginalis]|uniref:DDE-type integrase/transposase/recombinase n=1 Tax=Pseudomonas marginalis TaxID=298 RepID=A0A9X9BPA6_PSEMA|nr:Mu transposase C-terminal domain-containing protein [Pseudomonas marginalis]TWR52075.1 DDE-type integrase/transposase/recombinase [Pseudomonas marginalis]SED59652.1 Mu transposase, C-terminal [Pseudomonas marginalis]
MNFFVNDVFEPVTDSSVIGTIVRLIYLDEMHDLAVVIDLADPPRQPYAISLEELHRSVSGGDTKPVTIATPEFMLVLEDQLDEAAKLGRDEKWAIIAPLLDPDYPGRIFARGEFGPLVSKRASDLGIQRKKIYRLLYRYWIYGQIRNSLLNNYSAVGVSDRKYDPSKPPGRKPKFQGVLTPSSKMLSAVDKKCIRVGYALYVKDKKSSISSAYDEMLRRFYSVRDISKNSEEELHLLPSSEIPSLRQFRYWGQIFFDEIETERGRKGLRRWLKDCRPLSGTVRDWLRGPCHQFEIDATIADIYLVNSYSRRMLIGRPIVYIVVDSFSGMIVGLYVGLEGPSWNGARQALFNAFTSKVAFCAQNGVEINADDWDCHHLPHQIYADRGEMLSLAAEGLSSGLGIEMGTAPPYRPDWKPMVESRFGILNDLTGIRWLPGGVAARDKERGERDYRLDATLTLKEFTQILINCVLHYNRHHRQPDRLTQAMMNDGVEPTPNGIWSWACENDLVESNKRPDEMVYLHLLPRERATVQKGGVMFRGMHYVCDMAVEKNWFAKARKGGVWSIECWFDPNSAAHIWIQGDAKQFIRCDLRQSDASYANYRSDEIFDLLEAYRQKPPTHRRAELESRVQLSDQVHQIITNALSERELEPAPSTKAEATGNIRENRAEERLRERENAVVPAGVRAEPASRQSESTSTARDSYAGERTAQVIDLLKRIRPGQAQ